MKRCPCRRKVRHSLNVFYFGIIVIVVFIYYCPVPLETTKQFKVRSYRTWPTTTPALRLVKVLACSGEIRPCRVAHVQSTIASSSGGFADSCRNKVSRPSTFSHLPLNYSVKHVLMPRKNNKKTTKEQ